jgi:subtilisin family serine protease
MHDKMLLLLVLLALAMAAPVAAEQRATYIVHMSKSSMPPEYADHGVWYGESLRSVSGGGGGAKMLYAYDTVLHGFSAQLTASEARELAGWEGVLAVNPETRYSLHTTRTPEFLGIAGGGSEGLFPQSGTAGDVVVGVLDTGVWPERRSYDDAGLGEVPPWWKGECVAGAGFNASSCNRKLVGARFFSKGYEAAMGPMDTDRESRSPRDDEGHGTHTSSTAAGAAVPDASLFGFAAGTARGMAPRARVAAYKVCWLGGCFSSDILAGLDAAVADGCGVLSLSLGGGGADYSRDSVAIGAFAAAEQGVLVSCSSGNSGPGSSTLSNVAPWITTVGAGTLDRDFPAYVSLGNGKNYTGASLYSGKATLPTTQLLPIVYAANASNSTAGNLCMPGTLVPEKVAGKIVLCDRGVGARVQKGLVVRDAGGAGMVLSNTAANGQELVADAHLLPAAGVGEREGAAIKSYVSSDPRPTATIVVAGTHVDVHPSPVVAAFSSRGPNMVTPEILKPDVIAPGVNILAAWTGKAGPTGLAADTRRVGFNIISGTSMSCPHVSGLAALLRSAHPDWSPAAVRSALMTTAYSTYNNGDSPLLDAATGGAATPFDYGAGHVDPARAVDPGLVYDLRTRDYVDFLCALKYSPAMVATITRSKDYACAENKTYAVGDLNYPSFSVVYSTANGAGDSAASPAAVTRTLTNVGESGTYKVATSVAVKGVTVAVQPTQLEFSSVGEKKSYTVTFTSKLQPSGTTGFGRLVWSDGKHTVASPIAFTWA